MLKPHHRSRFLLDKFGGIQKTLDKWVSQLEQTAQTRHRGNRSRLEALEAASELIERFTAIAPTVPENQLESLLSHPQIMNWIVMTLQTQDTEFFRLSLPGGSLSLSGRRGTENLDAHRSFLDESIRTLVDNGPPVPLFYHYDDYLVDLPDKDPEHHYYGIQQQRVCAEEDDHWWEPEISYPCGLPGHVHKLAFCQEFWSMTPMDKHQKLLPGSLCKHCLGPLTLCPLRVNLAPDRYWKNYCALDVGGKQMSGVTLPSTHYSAPRQTRTTGSSRERWL